MTWRLAVTHGAPIGGKQKGEGADESFPRKAYLYLS